MYVMAQTYGVESILPLHRFASRGRTANKLRAVPVKLRIIEADAADIRRYLVSSHYLSSDLVRTDALNWMSTEDLRESVRPRLRFGVQRIVLCDQCMYGNFHSEWDRLCLRHPALRSYGR